VFTGFGGEGFPPTAHVYLVRVDPVRLKASLGLLPGVAGVRLRRGELVRFGRSVESARRDPTQDRSAGEGEPALLTVAMPAGVERVALPDAFRQVPTRRLRVIPDGDTYAAGR
jgi:hypothetical protein